MAKDPTRRRSIPVSRLHRPHSSRGYTRGTAAQRDEAASPASRGIRMLATTLPGLARLMERELAQLPNVYVHDTGYDGRSDIVTFEADLASRKAALGLRLTEDVFVEVGRTLRSEGDNPRWIAGRIWHPQRVAQALSVWAEIVRPLNKRMTFRVITRLLQERSFLRTELRREFLQAIGTERPKWSVGDPAQMEVWVMEYRPGSFIAGLRLSDVKMRQHHGRLVERPGALRPALAAAMVRLAGEVRGTLLDPCCGSGTILIEALAAGWREAVGADIDPGAVATARQNAPGAKVSVGDARKLDRGDASVAACVSNLPFGRQFSVQGDANRWLTAVLREMARVTHVGGRVVLLAPDISRTTLPNEFRLTDRFPLQLLGTKTVLWAYDRTG